MQTRRFQAPNGSIRIVPSGFSWGAFFLGPLWAFANRGHRLGILLFVAEMLVEIPASVMASQGPGWAVLGLAFSVAFMFVSGKYGRKWLAWSLARQGHEELRPNPA